MPTTLTENLGVHKYRATGIIALQDETVEIAIQEEVVVAQITGTWAGTLVFEVSLDAGSNWTATQAIDVNGNAVISSATGNDHLEFLHMVGHNRVRVRASAWTSGTANVVLLTMPGNADAPPAGSISLTGPLPDTTAGDLAAIRAATIALPAVLGNGGTKTVALAATPEVLTVSTPSKWVRLYALTTNTGVVGWGGSGIGVSGGLGHKLNPGDIETIPVSNAAAIYLSVSVNGEGVEWNYGV